MNLALAAKLAALAAMLLPAYGAEITVHAGNVSAMVDEGGLKAVTAGGVRMAVRGETVVDGLSAAGPKRAYRDGDTAVVERSVSGGGRSARIVERFSAGRGSIRWEVEIRGEGGPWTAPIHTRVEYPVTGGTKFWAAWSDPVAPDPAVEKRSDAWRDPLLTAAPVARRLWYGAPAFTYENPRIAYCPFYGDLLSIPLATFLEPQRDAGWSVALSPEGEWFDLTLETSAQGRLDFARQQHRLGGAQPVRFALDVVAHEADWRGGLRWMAARYPGWFAPVVPLAHELSGTGAYSATEVDFDVERMKKMAFRTNWKASFDFPYMGMFLPPVEEGTWPRYATRPPGTNTSNGQMAEYSRRMKAAGFHVLNYFNVTEFGARVSYPAPPRKAERDEDLWKNGDDFLYGKLAGAILKVPAGIPEEKLRFYGKTKRGGPYYTWGDGIVTDCGEPAYRQFLLDQARRHLEKLPDSSGICIDRMDWLRMYNEDRDDGVSWFGGKPVRSLYWSWRELMAELAPLFHGAGKAVFVNNHVKRIDLLKDVDGLFDEFTYNGPALNTTALLTVQKPALGWTGDEKQIRPDPDGFFQRFLYLGVFPMAPFPGNDHSLRPSEWVDAQYLAYGLLMNAMRGRVWVLEPHAIEVVEGKARANLFAVPGGGYVAAVMLGGEEKSARIEIRALRGKSLKAEALYPGASAAVPLKAQRRNGVWVLEVPLERGCAMVRLKAEG